VNYNLTSSGTGELCQSTEIPFKVEVIRLINKGLDREHYSSFICISTKQKKEQAHKITHQKPTVKNGCHRLNKQNKKRIKK